MEFNEFREEACGRDEKNVAKSTLGLIYCIPVEADDESGDYELSIDKMMTITKPSVNLTYVADPFRTIEFIRLDLEFITGYDPDVKEIFDFLKMYEKNASDFYDDIKKCPAFSVQVVPNNIGSKGIYYLELNMPMMISLTSNKQNQAPNMITMLFITDNCSIHEEELIDINEVKKEAIMETMEAEREAQLRIDEAEAEASKQKRMEVLQEQLNNLDTNNQIKRVGRGSKNEGDLD